MCKSRFTDGAWLCKKCWGKEAPADRVCALCPAGVDAVLSWRKSKRIEGAPWLCMACYIREVRASRFFPPFHANANARRSPPRFVSDSPRAVRVSRSSQHTEIITAAGTTCVVCKSSKTSTWCNSPNVPGGKVCIKCYHQDNRTSKKQKK
jgi:Zn ribbon nucleic-acid-binding protein